MRTMCGMARRAQTVVGRDRGRGRAAAVLPICVQGQPLLTDGIGEQHRDGTRLDQVDGTTCGSAVLVALAAWAGPAESARLGASVDFAVRYDARQQQVHRETNRLWPRALGTTPWGMVGWLHRNVPGAGRYHVRLVDDVSRTDVEDALEAVGAALAAGRPVPLLVGPFLPRHYAMALGLMAGEAMPGVPAMAGEAMPGVPAPGADEAGWRVYEPTSGSVRALDLDLVRSGRLAPVLGFDRLHAVLLPA